VSGPNAPSDGGQPRELFSPEEATRLWDLYRLGSGEAAEEAFDRLYRALHQPLLAFCKLRGCDAELADEVADRTWIRLIAAKPRAQRSFPSLLRKAAQNVLYETLRSERRERAIERDSESQIQPAARLECDERAKAVRDCLAKLPPQEQVFFRAIHVDGLTHGLAAELVGWSVAASTVHRRYLNIRAALVRCLKKKGIS